MTTNNGMRPVHPGEILRDELQELGLSANALSKALNVPVNRITAILHGQRGRDRRHGAPAGALFRDDAAGLAEPAKDLRAAPGGDRRGPPDHHVRTAPAHSGGPHRMTCRIDAGHRPASRALHSWLINSVGRPSFRVRHERSQIETPTTRRSYPGASASA